MAKIKINKLPEGFEIKNGKVEKMKAGGSTGDQADYGLYTGPYAPVTGQFNETSNADVRYSLSSVPKDIANIEAEGGETVLTDLNGTGRFGLYDIKGPRHTGGGVPMYLPQQSFIFSDTQAMKFNKNEMAEYGIESRKKMTPAQISKKYKINEYIGALDNEDIDSIGLKSAELMLDKNYKSLSKLAFGQEVKKDFSDGVPATAHPYLISKGIDPIEFTQKVEQSKAKTVMTPEQLMMQEMMQQAGQMSEAEYGYELPKAQVGEEKRKKRNIAYDPAMGEAYKPYGIDIDASGIGAVAYEDKQGYQGDGVYGDAKDNLEGFKTSWKELYPDTDKLVASLPSYKRGQKNPEVEKFQRWINSEYIPNEVTRIKQQVIDSGKTFTDADAKSLTERLTKDYGFKKGTGTDYDSLMGTWTSSRRPLTYNAKTDKIEPVEEKKQDPLDDPQFEKPRNPDFNFYQQDLVRGAAMAMRDRSLFLPFNPAVKKTKVKYALEEPTRPLADNNEQYNIGLQGLGAFAGPQSLSARLAGAQGNAFKNSANIFSDVHRRNINTVNQGLAMNAQFAAADNQEQDRRTIKQYDDTQATLQNYENDKNFDREQYADWYANSLDNATKAYNLNSLYRFSIDPTTGGTIDLAYAKPITPTKGQTAEDQRQQRLQNIDAIYNRYGDKVDAIKGAQYLESGQTAQQQNPYNNPYGIDPQLLMAQRSQSAKKGKEIKKYAIPFYTGKVGF